MNRRTEGSSGRSGGLKCAALLALSFCIVHPEGATAQAISGRVLDAETDAPISGVTISIVDDTGAAVASAVTEDAGTFLVAVRFAGSHTLRANRIGYTPFESEPLELARAELTELEIRLSSDPVTLDPLTITGTRRDPRHDATFEGAMVRYRQFPSVGSRRVVLYSDAPLRTAMRVGDSLQWFTPARGCTIVYWNGRLALHPEFAAMFLEDPAVHYEAVEFYRSWIDAPQGLKDYPTYVRDPVPCSVVALWSRRSADY